MINKPSIKRLIGLLVVLPVWVHIAHARNIDDQTTQQQAGTKESSAPVDRAAVQAWVKQLGSQSYAQRREAYSKLLQVGEGALTDIEEASNSPDRQIAESAGRLKKLLRVISKCKDPQIAIEVADLFLVPDDSNLGKFAELGLWELAIQFLDENESIETNCQKNFFEDLSVWYLVQRIIDQAEQQGDIQLAWPIVSRLTPSDLRYWTANKLKLPLAERPKDQNEEAFQLFLSGKIDEALDLKVVSGSLKYNIATYAFRWNLLADSQVLKVPENTGSEVSSQAAQAVFLEYAGEIKSSMKLWCTALGFSEEELSDGQSWPKDLVEKFNQAAYEKLKELAPITERSELTSRSTASLKPIPFYQLATALIVCGRVQALERYLVEEDRQAAFAFTLRNDYSTGFKTLGLEPDLSNFDVWLTRQSAEARLGLKSYERMPEPSMSQLHHAMNLGHVGAILAGVGHRKEAELVLAEMFTLSQKFVGESDVWNRCILRWMHTDKWRDLCIEKISSNFEQIPADKRSSILEKLFPELGDSALTLLMEAPACKLEAGEKDWPKAFEQLEYLERCDRDYFGPNSQNLVRSWLHRAALQKPKSPLSKIEDEEMIGDSESMLALARVANDWEDTSTALELLGVYSSQPIMDFDLYLLAAQIFLKAKQSAVAIDCIEAVAPGPGDHHWRSLVKLEALLSSGKVDEAQQEYVSRWMRMSTLSWNGDRMAGYRAVDDLTKAQRWEEALEYAERNFASAMAFRKPGSSTLDRSLNYYSFWQIRQYATILEELEQYGPSADVLRSLLVELLRPNAYVVRFLAATNDLDLLRYTASRERISRAVTEIQVGDFQAARRNLDAASRLYPQDVEAVVTCYPLLAKAGQIQFADEILTQAESVLKRQIESWPDDAMTHNNLAWMYAKSDVKLDEALVLAKRAIQLEPNSAVYRDTLAEIQFHLGDIEAAIETMRSCVRIDPRKPGYRKNLVRFSAARK